MEMNDVLRYLKGTPNFGFCYLNHLNANLGAWSHDDWMLDQGKRRSRSRTLSTIGGNPVTWTSKMQPEVAISIAEAEFYSLSECARYVQWCRQVLCEIGINLQRPNVIYRVLT